MSGTSIISINIGSIYGLSSTSTATSTPAAAQAALVDAEKNQTKDVATEAKQPQVANAIQKFQAAVGKATSISSLLNNPNVLNVLLTANGLGDQTAYPALAKAALMSDPSNPKSVANSLATSNSAWASAASTYNFFKNGLSVLQNPTVMSDITSGYAEVMWRQSLDATTPGLSNALDFRSQASSITKVDQILGSMTLRTVVTTALGIPAQIAYQDLGAQEKAITNRLDISQLQDPKFVDQFTQRYLAVANESSTGTSSASLESLANTANTGLVV